MIGRLSGVIAEKTPPLVVIDVAGVGYEVDVPMSTFFNLGALGERAEAAVVADLAVVGEEVLAAVIRRDEAEALAVVEPFHGAGLSCHGVSF